MAKQWKQWQTLFWGIQNHCRWWLQPWNEKTLAPWKKSYDQPRQHIKKQRHYYFADKDLYSQNYGFSSSHVSIPGLGRSPGEGKGYPLQYSGLENSMDCVVHGVAKSWTRLSGFHFHLRFSTYGVMSSTDSDSFTSSFPTGCLSFLVPA